MTQMAKIDTQFMSKTGEKRYPLGPKIFRGLIYHVPVRNNTPPGVSYTFPC